MNTSLHLVDPHLDRINQILIRFTRSIIEIYLALLGAFGNIFLMVLGVIFVIVSVLNINNNDALLSAVFMPIGLLWILSKRGRIITWIFLGFSVLWIAILTAALVPFLGTSPSLSLIPKIAIAVADFLPPLIATIVTLRFIKAAEQGAAANP